VLIGGIVTAIVANFLMIVLMMDGFTPWKSLPKLPSQAIHIAYADTNNVWVETNGAQKFTLPLNCYNNQNCYRWIKVDDVPKPMDGYSGVSLYRGTDCTSINNDRFPIALSGKVIECVKVVEVGAEFMSVVYFALMADGTLQYWQGGSNAIATELFPVFATIITIILVFFVTVIISAVYLIKNIIRRIREQR
jgi:hypothetical protein